MLLLQSQIKALFDLTQPNQKYFWHWENVVPFCQRQPRKQHWENTALFSQKQPINHTLIENLSFLRALKLLKFEFAIEAIIIFVKNKKRALSGMFTLLVSQ